jgi:hypothetical protein
MGKKDKGDGKARIESLENRLQRLEALLAGARPPAIAPRPDADAPAEGAARLRLDLRGLGPGWRRDSPVSGLLAADWPGCAARLAALGHPTRLAILRRALDGPVTATALRDVLDAGQGSVSTGQLYHHLRELTATGWLEAQGRGRFALPQGRTGPLLAALSLALVD